MGTTNCRHVWAVSHTLNPNSPGFSASKSYNAVQQGELRGICRWTDLIGEETGDAT